MFDFYNSESCFVFFWVMTVCNDMATNVLEKHTAAILKLS